MRNLLILMSFYLLAGCAKQSDQPAKYCATGCSTFSYTPVFENYAPEELDSVTVKCYADSTFSINALVNERSYSLADTMHIYGIDGQLLGIGFKPLLLPIDQAYEIKVYATGRNYRIWNIKESEEQETYECSVKNYSCTRKAKSYSFSGGLQRVEQTSSSAYLVLTH